MKKHNHTFLGAAATTLAISLTSPLPLSANETPFQMKEVQRQSTVDHRLAHGMCGACGGRCGGMMDGMMMGGSMPRALDPAQLPDPDSTGAKLVTQYCTQCHGLPGPKQHSAAGWPATVARMNTRMQWMNRNNSPMDIIAPTRNELATLTGYLEKHASAPEDTPTSDNPTKR